MNRNSLNIVIITLQPFIMSFRIVFCMCKNSSGLTEIFITILHTCRIHEPKKFLRGWFFQANSFGELKNSPVNSSANKVRGSCIEP